MHGACARRRCTRRVKVRKSSKPHNAAQTSAADILDVEEDFEIPGDACPGEKVLNAGGVIVCVVFEAVRPRILGVKRWVAFRNYIDLAAGPETVGKTGKGLWILSEGLTVFPDERNLIS